jgi:hypothetical protein
MPTLQLTLDYPLKILLEPGFGRDLLATNATAQPALDGNSPADLWMDPLTHTVMLRPLQLRPDWLNTIQQHASIVRLAQMNVNPSDRTSGAIMEQAVFGNADDPWVYHFPVGPGAAFPAAVNPEVFPGTAPSILGYTSPVDMTTNDLFTVRPNPVYIPSATVPPPPPAAPPMPVPIGSTASGKIITETATKFPANQGFYLRWYQAPSRLGFPFTYTFCVGQFRLDIKETMIQVFQDASAHGDRSAWRHVTTFSLFAGGNDTHTLEGLRSNWIALFNPSETTGHDRSLLWLPFRRNQVLLIGNQGQARLLQVKPTPNRLPDNSDWDITRSDTVLTWALSPHWGRYQVQTLAYPTAAVVWNAPEIILDYTPTLPPATKILADTDHLTSISVVQTSPPSYLLPVNNINDCPVIDMSIPSYQARHYGHQLNFQASGDGRWTPFFYDLQVTAPTTFQDPTTTPTVVPDSSAGNTAYLVSAEITAGSNPGEGRATFEVMDFPPYTLSNYYYRSGNPVQLTDGGTAVFTGITLPQELTPLKQQTTVARRLTFTAADRWWELDNSWLRDTRAWVGVGHMDAVNTILQLAGIDITGLESPPKNAMNNTVLGGSTGVGDAFLPIQNDYQPAWQPAPTETAGAFVKKIAEKFAGWEIGCKPSGEFFYRPRYFYTASEVTFYESAAAATADGHTGGPLYRSPVTFTTEEPEANVILVKANSDKDGSPLYSSLWVDWASLSNKLVKNYVGRRKQEIIEIRGMYSCAALNRVAKKIWEFTRRRHVVARFQCDYNALVQVGHVLTLHGDADYRVLSYTATFAKRTWGTMSVEAELVESGVGL